MSNTDGRAEQQAQWPEANELSPEVFCRCRLRPPDEDAWTHLLVWVQRLAWRQISRVRCPDEDKKDIVQEVLLSVYKDFERFRGPVPFYHWVKRITSNRIVDFMRKLRKQRFYEVAAQRDVDYDALFDNLPDNALDAYEQLALSERVKLRNKVVERLPPHYREALALQDAGLSNDEIASALNKSYKAVSMYLHKAKKIVAVELAKVTCPPFLQTPTCKGASGCEQAQGKEIKKKAPSSDAQAAH